MVHDGIKPGLKVLPEDDANKSTMSAKEWREAESLLRVRRINADGTPVLFGNEQGTDHFWAETYDGRFGTVIFGHEAVLNDDVHRFPYAVGIDLGCVYGGHLAALIFSDTGQVYEKIFVKAQKTYCHRT